MTNWAFHALLMSKRRASYLDDARGSHARWGGPATAGGFSRYLGLTANCSKRTRTGSAACRRCLSSSSPYAGPQPHRWQTVSCLFFLLELVFLIIAARFGALTTVATAGAGIFDAAWNSVPMGFSLVHHRVPAGHAHCSTHGR